jgi:hypothetical protein
MIDRFPCPRCGRPLARSGEVTDPARGPCSVFQCDECLAVVPMYGEDVEVALTFAVDGDGRAFDPATGDDVPAG